MSRKISNASAPSTIKARASVGLCGVRGSYEGTVSSFWKIGGPVVGITVAVGLIVLPKIRKKLVKARIENEILKSVIRKDEACENSRIKKDEAEQQCDLDIRKAKGLSQVKIDETRALFEIRREFGPMGKSTGQEQNPHEESSLGEWLQWFNRECPMPCHSAIPTSVPFLTAVLKVSGLPCSSICSVATVHWPSQMYRQDIWMDGIIHPACR